MKTTEIKRKETTVETFLPLNNVQSVYKSLRKVKSVKDKWFLYYLTKEYMDMGYYDKSDEKKFKKAFDDVI